LDGRKNNKGVVGNKGGRKPKADEVKLIESMDAVMAPLEAWQALALKVKEGDVQAVKTWLNYRFGMPKQAIDMKGEGITPPVSIVIKDMSKRDE
jgi:hypothetical protein